MQASTLLIKPERAQQARVHTGRSNQTCMVCRRISICHGFAELAGVQGVADPRGGFGGPPRQKIKISAKWIFNCASLSDGPTQATVPDLTTL